MTTNQPDAPDLDVVIMIIHANHCPASCMGNDSCRAKRTAEAIVKHDVLAQYIEGREERARATAMGDAARNFQSSIDAGIREVQAKAWDEGFAEAIDDYGTDIPWGGSTSDHNPYRTKT